MGIRNWTVVKIGFYRPNTMQRYGRFFYFPKFFKKNVVGVWGCVSCLEGRSVRSTERSEARKAATPLGVTP